MHFLLLLATTFAIAQGNEAASTTVDASQSTPTINWGLLSFFRTAQPSDIESWARKEFPTATSTWSLT